MATLAYPSSRNIVVFIFLHALSLSFLASGRPANFLQDFRITWSDWHIRQIEAGRAIQLVLDQNSGCGFASKSQYLFGRVSMKIKLIPGDSAGTVTAFYMNSDTDTVRDELDFEFLGNRTGQPYTVQTNVYAHGKGDREQRVNLWFDPAADFHTYSILWNHHHVVFYVDEVPIRVYKNNEARGLPYPKFQPMGIYSTLWEADDWATRGGLEKIDWSKAPFYAYYKDFDIEGCPMPGPTTCASNAGNWWEGAAYQQLSPVEARRYKWVRMNRMIYDYCVDKSRPPPPPSLSEMENYIPHPAVHDDPASSLWDWSDILDFTLDDQLNISLDSDDSPAEPDLPTIPPNPDSQERVRKRDPRLTCSNFLARIPCACPELDEKLEEEEEGLPGKKRARRVRAAAAGTARCQVPGCGADISELKGYHRRHRVCLRCANASTVVLDGQRKRYCQQCGKFHILSDFDEGKRSCRRKLERHNNRRRRKPSESRVAVERESQGLVLAEDDENGQDGTCLSNQIAEREPLLESEGQFSTLCSNPGSQNIQSDSVVSFVSSGEAQIDGEKDESNYARCSFNGDNKSSYSSMCPTGRISFKLYDWNPAEFPRRLRHQIFQWLASMPVELEGYIRPGCIILTVFVAMPNFMWFKLLHDPVVFIRDFVAAPGKMLAGRGTLLVYLDNVIFRVMKDGTSVMQVKVEEQAPKLHYVHPTCFEAGKPMEFVACGSNLLQRKFRFLVSFAGKYLAYDYSVPPLHGDTEGVTANFDHQLLKIYIPHTEPDLFGPAFVEVENESGLSNFLPILIGSKEICSEMKIMEHRFETSLCLKGSKFIATSSLSDSCEVSILRQTACSQFILDTAWLLRRPALEDIKHTSTLSQIGRFTRLLAFLIDNESISILEKVLHYMEIVMDNMKLDCLVNGIADTEMKLLQSNLDHARGILHERLQENGNSVQHSRNLVPKGNYLYQNSQINMLSVVAYIDQMQDIEMTEKGNLDALVGSNSQDNSGTIPLLNREVVMSMNLMKERPRKSCSRVFARKYLTSRPLIYVIAAAAVCFGICVAVLHPQKVGKIATTMRRCLFDNT